MSSEHQKEETEEGFPFFRSVPTELESLIVEKIPFDDYITLMKTSHEAFAMLKAEPNKTILHALDVKRMEFHKNFKRFSVKFNSPRIDLSEAPNVQILAKTVIIATFLDEEECNQIIETIKEHKMRAKKVEFLEEATCSLEGFQKIIELLTPNDIEFHAEGFAGYLKAEGCKKAMNTLWCGLSDDELLQQSNPRIIVCYHSQKTISVNGMVQFIQEWIDGLREIKYVIINARMEASSLQTIAEALGLQTTSSNTLGIAKERNYLYVRFDQDNLYLVVTMKFR